MSMQVKIESLLEGAKRAEGLAVIIDVFRAFTVIPCLLNNGAERVIPVDSVEEAFKIKKQIPEAVMAGERKGLRVKNFDYGNSPYVFEKEDFTNKTVIMSTSGGTRGVKNAKQAQEVLTGSFVNASATIEYIRKKQPEIVTLVPVGVRGEEHRDEDWLCAEYIKNALENKKTDFSKIVEHLKNYKSAKKFLDPEDTNFPEGDFWLAMELDKFNFAVKAHYNQQVELRKKFL